MFSYAGKFISVAFVFVITKNCCCFNSLHFNKSP